MFEPITIILFMLLYLNKVSTNITDYYVTDPSKVVKMTNEALELKCGLKLKHAVFNMNSKVSWYFKPCSEHSQRSCKSQEIINSDWIAVNCGDDPCATNFILKNTTKGDSGLYLCKMYPYRIDNQTILQIQVVKTFQIQILDLTSTVSITQSELPEILEVLPTNITVNPNTQIILQCKIKSVVKPTIKWFRRKNEINELEYSSRHRSYESFRNGPQFEGSFYEPQLQASLAKHLSDNIYLSKLIVNEVLQHSVYVCVAINYRGYVYGEYHVLSESEDKAESQIVEIKSNHTLYLFVVVIIILAIPISCLLCTIFYLVIQRNLMNKLNK